MELILWAVLALVVIAGMDRRQRPSTANVNRRRLWRRELWK